MKLKTHHVPGWWTLSLRAFVVILGLVAAAAVASAQESKPAEKATTSAIVPAESADPTTTKPEIDAKMPDAIQSLMPSIVTVTRIEPADGDPANKLVSHAGIVVDPRGYIVAPLLPSQSRLKQFVVRLANQKEFVGELVGSDETLKLGVLKIESPQSLVAVSLAKIREAQVGDKVLLVTSPASKERFSGRVTSTTVDFGNENSPKFLQTDIAFPLSEYGSLMVSELGEPIGIFMASRPGEPPVSMATPLKLAMKLIDATTNPESKADAERPVFAVGLEPATLLFKQVVELFGPRGMKVTAFEEGKTLKIEATTKEVVEDLNNLLELVAQELRKQAEPGSKPSAEKSSAVSLEPATTLAKSLVELFGPRGAKVLDFEAGKRLKVEAPGDVLLDLEKMLKLVANEAQKQVDLKRTLGLAPPGANESVRVTGTPNESQPELASERLFHVRRNQTQPGGQRDGQTLAWVAVDPASSDVDNLKPGDVVDLVLPGDESFVVLDSDQTYVPKFKSVIEHVLVEQLQRPGNRRQTGSNHRYVGLRIGIQITPAEIARIQSVPTYHDLSNSTITHVVRLKHIRAEHLFDLLHRSFSNVVFENDAERNTIVLFWNLSSPIQGLMDTEAAIRKLDIPSTGLAVESTASRALPDTPAAKQLVEQLGAQESAAAAEAATIRQLQANGQAEQNRRPIAEHQRKLKNLLSTAFDLKLQLEELQVKELQSRLSRLERQIGQRKELRERIITRRADELIEGETLKWSLDAASFGREKDLEVRADSASSSPSVATDPKAEMLARLQGVWDVQVRTHNRDNNPAPEVIRAEVEINGNLMTMWAETAKERIAAYSALLMLCEPGPPQQIDMTFGPNDGNDRFETYGLIECADDLVRICFEFSPESKRPEVFAVGMRADIWELRRKAKSRDPKPAALPSSEELEFLSQYPRFSGLSLDMTEPQFLEIVKQQELKTKKMGEGDKTAYYIGLGDGLTLIVMFRNDGTCRGIQRIRGEDNIETSPPVGLEFLKPYPKLHGLSLDMTEPQFSEIVKQQELKTRKTVAGEKVTHHIGLGDDHTLLVMFDKDAKCSGIQRVRGADAVDEAISLAEAVSDFNAENERLGRGDNQFAVTEEEVITVIQREKWNCEDLPLNEKEITAFKAVAASKRLPKGSYLDVHTEELAETFLRKQLWQVRLMLPAIGHDGFVGLTIRDTLVAEEKIDPKQVAWGKPDPDGLSLGAYLSPKKDKYQIGERVRLRLFVRNEGQKVVGNLTFPNLPTPDAKDFTVTDQTGANVVVRLGHEGWDLHLVAGATGGVLKPGDAHAFRVLYEISIGGDGSNPLVGRVIDARPGQTLQLKVRAFNGSTRKEGDAESESGSISLTVAEDPIAPNAGLPKSDE